MFFRFNTLKIVQAAAVLLRLEQTRRMPYLRLLKLMYIADRESLRKARRPIIGSRAVAMKNGPLHSELYDLIKGEHIDEPLWSKFIEKHGYQVELNSDPGVSELSRHDIEILTRVFDDHSAMGEWDLVEETHAYPEWKKHYPDPQANTSCTIPLEDILEAVGLSAAKDEILAEVQEDHALDALFGRCQT